MKSNSQSLPDQPSRVVIGTGIGVGIALAAGAIGALVASNAKNDDRARLLEQAGGRSACWSGASPHPSCNEISDASAAERTFRGVAIAGFITGGVTLAATLAYALWPRSESKGGDARIVLAPSARGGGLVVLGAF